jgi:hypothetical protein
MRLVIQMDNKTKQQGHCCKNLPLSFIKLSRNSSNFSCVHSCKLVGQVSNWCLFYITSSSFLVVTTDNTNLQRMDLLNNFWTALLVKNRSNNHCIQSHWKAKDCPTRAALIHILLILFIIILQPNFSCWRHSYNRFFSQAWFRNIDLSMPRPCIFVTVIHLHVSQHPKLFAKIQVPRFS